MRERIVWNEVIDETCCQLFYQSYLNEQMVLGEFRILDYDAYCQVVLESGSECVSLLMEDEVVAALLYVVEENDEIDLMIPVYGYGYTDIRYMSMLLQKLLAKYVTKTTHISFDGYAHDDELFRYLALTRFGVSMSFCLRKIRKIENTNQEYPVRKLGKNEMNERWDEVWNLLKMMVDHLHESPVFWFGDYTETFYRGFFNEKDVDVYAAFDGDQIIGIIETNADEEGFIMHEEGHNVSEACVKEEYRRIGVAEALLSVCEEDLLKKGIQYDWVNHGTCNPNARGFWDKYFKPYKYTFKRDVYFDERKEKTSYVD